jgi:hypothetical protein
MASVQRLWLGYTHDGGKATLDVGGPGSKVLLLGSKAGELAALSAVSAKEAAASPIIFDMGGSLSNGLSGYFETYDYRAFLYDAFRLAEPEAWHSQLAAAAYTVALDLTSEEEAIINSAMQVVASDGTLLSPVSIHDVMGKVEGFRGFYVDKLNGRIGGLRLFDAVEDQSFDRLLRGNVIIDFHRAPYPQAAELAVALFVAKLLAMDHSQGAADAFVLMTEAHRIFRGSPRTAHSNRLLTHLLAWAGKVVLASEQQSSLSPVLLQSATVKLYSSDAWHSLPRQEMGVLSGHFVLEDTRNQVKKAFVPRLILSKTAGYAPTRPAPYPTPALTKLILDEVARFPLSTPQSVLQFVSPEFLPADVQAGLASLEKQGCLILEPKDSGTGPRIFAYTLTEKGRNLLEELGS